MIHAVQHHELARQIERLITQERYTDAQELLPRFAEAVVQACNGSGSEQEFLQAKEFLRSAVVAVKARRAHYLVQISEIKKQRAYLDSQASDPLPHFDVTG